MTGTRRLLRTRRWTPPPAPPDHGRSAATASLHVTGRLAVGGTGPEDVRFDDSGSLVTGLRDGRVVRIDPATGERTVLGSTGGQLLGVLPCPDGSVLVCDYEHGLLRLRPGGGVERLADSVDGEHLTFPSNAVQGPDGTIWFTTSTSRWDVDHHQGDLYEHSCTGRLVRVDPDGTVTTVLSDLAFANGLVLAPDGSHLLWAETGAYRISRYWLTGPLAGRAEPLVENLPGFPDNMSLGSDGLVWVAFPAPRNVLLDRLLTLPGVLRLLVWNLPEAVKPKPVPITWVMALTLDGVVVHDLRVTGAGYGFVTAVAERDGVLALCSIHAEEILLARRP